MTEQTQAPVIESTNSARTTDTSTEAAETSNTTKSGNQEAAKYRTQLRETEKQLEEARNLITQIQQQQVEDLAAQMRVLNPKTIWAGGLDLAALTTEAGTIDTEGAQAAILQQVEDLGLAVGSGTPKPDLTQGGRSGGPVAPNSWLEAMKP